MWQITADFSNVPAASCSFTLRHAEHAMPERGWIKTVSAKWVSVIAEHRPAVICLWQIRYNAWSRVEPGDLILLKREGSYENIVGFGTVVGRMPAFTSNVWKRYGLSTGSPNQDDLEEQVLRRIQTPRADPIIGIVLIENLIIFPERPFKLFQSTEVPTGFTMSTALPADTCARLLLLLYAHRGRTELAEQPAAQVGCLPVVQQHAWEDTVRTAYRGFCAVTAKRVKNVLSVVAIQPFQDGGPPLVSNGLLLDLVLAELYRKGLIAFHTNGVLLVSPDIALEDAKLYRDLAGQRLKPPRRPEDEPDGELVLWRFNNRFHR